MSEELGAVGLVVFGGVVALAEQDGDEVESGLEKLHRSQMVSNVQSRATGRVQCPLPRSLRWSAASRRIGGPTGQSRAEILETRLARRDFNCYFRRYQREEVVQTMPDSCNGILEVVGR